MKNDYIEKKALRWIIHAEGGYVNNPDDPGGETNYGISKKSYPDMDIPNITYKEACDIYIRDYWDRINADKIPYPLSIYLFDMAVNAGCGRAVKILQKLIGTKQDGIIGPKTTKAVNSYHYVNLAEEYMWKRIEYYTTLKNAQHFLKGWMNRLINLRDFIRNEN